jgi:hypothetical protein
VRSWGRFGGALAFAVFGVFLGGPPVQGQNLGAEIQGLEKNLKDPGLSGAERRNTLMRLAGLRELSGDFEAAAGNWREAAAGPGGPDDLSLIREARCLAAMGEWDRAGKAVQTVLLARRPGPALLKARYTAALIEALGAGEFSALETLAGDPDFAGLRPAVYYTLWKAQSPSGESWKTRLLAEFPRSPEGRIAASEGAAAGKGGNVNAAPAPMWLLLPGRESPDLTAPGPAAAPAVPATAPGPAADPGTAAAPAVPATAAGAAAAIPGTAATPAVPATAPGPAAAPGTAAAPAVPATAAGTTAAAAVPTAAVPAAGGSVLLQTGLFGSQGNAEKQAEQLRAAGFSPLIVRRRVRDAEYWAVGLSPDPGKNLGGQLKNAGFESFPVNLSPP